MLEKLSMKRIYIIIGSVILAILILLSVIFFLGKSDKKHDKSKVSGKVDSSMVDESSDKDSSDESSSSTDDSKTDSKIDSKTDLSSTGDSSAVVTDAQGRVIPTSPSGGGTQPSGGGTTKTPTGTTTPSTQTMTISLASFAPYAERNITTGLGMPVFEYIFGKQTTENGIPTKCIQQRDTVVLKTSQPITKLDFDSSLINATYSGNTITVTAKYNETQYYATKATLTINEKYKYNFSIYDDTNYSTWSGYGLLVEFYWDNKLGNTFITTYSEDISYTKGNSSLSLTGSPYKQGDTQFDDTINYSSGKSVKDVLDLLNKYKQKGFTKVRTFYDYPLKHIYFGACK